MECHGPRLVLIAGVGALVLAACVPSANVPTFSPAIASPSATATSSPTAPAISLPSATLAVAKRSPSPVPAERPSDLVVRHEMVGDVCCPNAVAVVTAEGRFVTRTDDNELRERSLTPAGVQRVRDELVATGLFESDQRFPLERRPGATPPARGVGGLLFKVWRDTRAVQVASAFGQGPDEVYFQPSAARTRLDRLSKQLRTPETWLPADAWSDPTPRPYDARLFALLLRTEVGQANQTPTIDALSAVWPFSVGPLTLGETMPVSAGPFAESTRCSVLTKDDMLALHDAMVRAAGAGEIYSVPDGTFVAGFAARDQNSQLVVIVRPLLPDRASCNGEYAF